MYTPHEVRELLGAISLKDWYVNVQSGQRPVAVHLEDGHEYRPHRSPGFLLVDGEPYYSAAWL